MRGTTMECLRHYLAQFPTDKRGVASHRQPFSDFIGVSEPTVRRWMSGDGKPVGLVLVKVRYFLEDHGYEVEELEALHPTIRRLGCLIAHNVVDIEDAKRAIGIANLQELLRVLHGKQLMLKNRMDTANAICVKHAETLREYRWRQTAEGTPTNIIEHPASSVTPPDDVVPALLRALNGITSVLQTYLERILADEVSAEERRELREKLGSKFVFELSNRVSRINKQLSGLCSEKARELVSTENGTTKRSGDR